MANSSCMSLTDFRDPRSKLVTVESPPLVLSTGGRSGLALAISAEAPNVVQVRGSCVPCLRGGALGGTRLEVCTTRTAMQRPTIGTRNYELASVLG